MQIVARIRAIEVGLKDAGVPLSSLFREASIDRSTWTRWRSGTTGPRLTNWLAIEAAASKLAVKGIAETAAF